MGFPAEAFMTLSEKEMEEIIKKSSQRDIMNSLVQCIAAKIAKNAEQ